MGVIKINNIIYGSNNASDIIYKDITVEEKLDTIPIFDINDNGAVVVESDVLTYGHIVDNLNSTESNKILSAKQGKVLNDKIRVLEEEPQSVVIKMTQADYDALPDSKYSDGILYAIVDDNGDAEGGMVAKPVELTKAQYEALGDSVLNDNILYAITDGDGLTAKGIEYDGSASGLGNNIQDAIDKMGDLFKWKLVGEAASSTAIILPDVWNEIEIICSDKEYNTTIVTRCSYESVKHFILNTVFGGGYGVSNAYGLYYGSIGTTYVNLTSAYWNGQDRLPYVITTVYYR